MFTLKLYRDGPLPPKGRAVVMEVVGIWVDYCSGGVKQIKTFKRKVGVWDENDDEFFVGGEPVPEQDAIIKGDGGNYYGWGVLENAQGKTTEIFR